MFIQRAVWLDANSNSSVRWERSEPSVIFSLRAIKSLPAAQQWSMKGRIYVVTYVAAGGGGFCDHEESMCVTRCLSHVR